MRKEHVANQILYEELKDSFFDNSVKKDYQLNMDGTEFTIEWNVGESGLEVCVTHESTNKESKTICDMAR